MADMLAPDREERPHMIVVQRVPDEFALPPRPHEMEGAEYAQLVRDGGLRHAEHGGEIADAERFGSQRGEEPHARWVAQRAEQRGEIARRVVVRQRRPRPSHPGGMDMVNIAGLRVGEC